MNTDANEISEYNIPEDCPKCSQGAFYRMSPDDEWHFYFCDPPPFDRRMIEQNCKKGV